MYRELGGHRAEFRSPSTPMAQIPSRRSRSGAAKLILIALGLVVAWASPSMGAVTKSGSVDWSGGSSPPYTLYVGHYADGALQIDSGSWISYDYGYFGCSAGCTGTGTVTGTGSNWALTGHLYVGSSGIGKLYISSGGQISDIDCYIGQQAGSSGTVAVTGTGSGWTNAGTLYVGYAGSGGLRADNGGSVTALNLCASLGDLSGNATITAKGGVLDADLTFDGTHGLTKALTFGTGGTLNLNFDGTTLLGAGYKTTGTIRIAEGIAVACTYGYLGYWSGSSGTATVTGTGSKWTNTNALAVGNYGAGAMSILNGGQVSDSSGTIACYSGSTGTVLVSGTGSTWASTGSICPGSLGAGSLTIEAGGQVTDGSGVVGGSSGSTGAVTVTGSGSKWANSADVTVGNAGAGALNILAGGQVANRNAYIGYSLGSTGTATVSGSGSSWTNSTGLYVSYNGSGKLNVSNGGAVSAQMLYASLSDLSGNGTITARGAVLDTDLLFDITHGMTQAIPFGTGGTLNLTITATSNLGVGYRGTGTLRVASGRQVAHNYSYLGLLQGSNGTAVVTGSGSLLSNWFFYVGNGGTGALRVDSGGRVSSAYGYIGEGSGSTGTATVTGSNSTWAASYRIIVGDSGIGGLNVAASAQVTSGEVFAGFTSFSSGTIKVTGTGSTLSSPFLELGVYGSGSMNVEAGGQVSSTNYAWIGAMGGSTGTATVTDAGSTWTIYSDFRIGRQGNGSLNILAGGQVSSGYAYVGYGTGTAKVSGSGSKWTNPGAMYIGYDGDGKLIIENGGLVSNGNSLLGYASHGGMVTVTGLGSTWINGGALTLGMYGKGNVTVADGGMVTAPSVSVSAQSAVKLHVSGNNMLLLGNFTAAGSVANNGKVSFYADAFLPSGIYTPISDCNDRAMTWSGAGAYIASGGTWDDTAKTLTVTAPTALAAGSTTSFSVGQRLLFADTNSGRHAGASFGTFSGGTTFSASVMSQSDLDALAATGGFQGSVLSAWSFNTDITGGEVLLSYDIGLGAQNVNLWHLHGGTWTAYAPDLMTYDSSGNLSFTVTDFSGYAVAGVPEPATLFLLAIGGLAMIRRRRH